MSPLSDHIDDVDFNDGNDIDDDFAVEIDDDDDDGDDEDYNDGKREIKDGD